MKIEMKVRFVELRYDTATIVTLDGMKLIIDSVHSKFDVITHFKSKWIGCSISRCLSVNRMKRIFGNAGSNLIVRMYHTDYFRIGEEE